MAGDPDRERTTGSPAQRGAALPEKLMQRLLGRLKRHALWDSLLMLLPPLGVFVYLGAFLYWSAFLARGTVIGAGVAVLGTALALGVLRHRKRSFSLRFAARLMDIKAQAQDRFLTLASVDRLSCRSFLLVRLQEEAVGLLHRIDWRRDFPYRLKRSFMGSAIASLIVFILFQILLELWFFFNSEARTANELAILARELARLPALSELARDLNAVAVEIKKEKGTANAQKESQIQELLRRVEEHLRTGSQQGAGDALLAQTANALRELAGGSGQRQGASGGELKSDMATGGKGTEEKSSGTGDGDREGQTAGVSERLTGGRAETKGTEMARRESDQVKSDKPQLQPGGGRESEGGGRGDLGRSGGRSTQEEIPRGAPPERFFKPGEQGDRSIKDARFVTVQLPEAEAEASGGEGGSEAKRVLRPKVSISNVPLRRPHAPEASPEKQSLPVEYRELIR